MGVELKSFINDQEQEKQEAQVELELFRSTGGSPGYEGSWSRPVSASGRERSAMSTGCTGMAIARGLCVWRASSPRHLGRDGS